MSLPQFAESRFLASLGMTKGKGIQEEEKANG